MPEAKAYITASSHHHRTNQHRSLPLLDTASSILPLRLKQILLPTHLLDSSLHTETGPKYKGDLTPQSLQILKLMHTLEPQAQMFATKNR